MKKVYEAPKMLEEVVCVEEPLAMSLPVFGGEDDDTAGEGDILSKGRESSIWD